MRRALLLGAALALSSGGARAQWTCLNCTQEIPETFREIARAAKVVEEINNQILQLEQIKNTVLAVAHGNIAAADRLLPELGLDSNLFGGETGELMSSLAGLASAGGRTAALAQQLMQTDAFYLPTAKDWAATAMMSAATAAATRKAMATTALQSVDRRMTLLQDLRSRLDGSATDVAGASQATARLAGETAVGVERLYQLQAARALADANQATLVAQTAQMQRCSFERLSANAKAAGQAAAAGTVQFFTNVPVACSTTAADAQVASADPNGTAGSLTQDASLPVPLASGIAAFLGQSVGSGECVALVQAADPSVGRTATWVQGDQVQGNTSLQPGTPIATFGAGGRYDNATDGSSHAAIYLGQNAQGIQVEDQWNGQPAHQRTIRFGSGGTAANSGEAFYVITHGA